MEGRVLFGNKNSADINKSFSAMIFYAHLAKQSKQSQIHNKAMYKYQLSSALFKRPKPTEHNHSLHGLFR